MIRTYYAQLWMPNVVFALHGLVLRQHDDDTKAADGVDGPRCLVVHEKVVDDRLGDDVACIWM